jgi:hypothetical protein
MDGSVSLVTGSHSFAGTLMETDADNTLQRLDALPLEIVIHVLSFLFRAKYIYGLLELLRDVGPGLLCLWKMAALERLGKLLPCETKQGPLTYSQVRKRLIDRTICVSCASRYAKICPRKWNALPMCLRCIRAFRPVEIVNKTDLRKMGLSSQFSKFVQNYGGPMRCIHGGTYVYVSAEEQTVSMNRKRKRLPQPKALAMTDKTFGRAKRLKMGDPPAPYPRGPGNRAEPIILD